jgi:hypothetical protein
VAAACWALRRPARKRTTRRRRRTAHCRRRRVAPAAVDCPCRPASRAPPFPRSRHWIEPSPRPFTTSKSFRSAVGSRPVECIVRCLLDVDPWNADPNLDQGGKIFYVSSRIRPCFHQDKSTVFTVRSIAVRQFLLYLLQ